MTTKNEIEEEDLVPEEENPELWERVLMMIGVIIIWLMIVFKDGLLKFFCDWFFFQSSTKTINHQEAKTNNDNNQDH